MQIKVHYATEPSIKPLLLTNQGRKYSSSRVVEIGLTSLMAVALVAPATAGGYKITDLGIPPGVDDSFSGAFAQAINNRGHVVVYAHNSPFNWYMFGDNSF